jgi:hypothetical protein
MRNERAIACRPVVGVVAATVALALVGCSSDESTEPVPTPADTPPADPTTTDPTTTDASTVPVTAERTDPPDATPVSSAEPTPADGSLYPPGQVDEGLRPWIEDATADLADRTGVQPDAIDVVSAVLVTWPDAALGCPEPGMQYAQVLTDGAVIELAVDDAIYRYHAGGDQGPFLCARPIAEPPAAAG